MSAFKVLSGGSLSFSLKRGRMEAMLESFHVPSAISLPSARPIVVTISGPGFFFVWALAFSWECYTMSTGTMGVVAFLLSSLVKFLALLRDASGDSYGLLSYSTMVSTAVEMEDSEMSLSFSES